MFAILHALGMFVSDLLKSRSRLALKKDGRALYRVILTGTIDLPPPGLGRIPSPLHDERKIGWVELFTHAPINGDGRLNFQTAATSDQLLFFRPHTVRKVAVMLGIINDSDVNQVVREVKISGRGVVPRFD
jgi:hypothetical protein